MMENFLISGERGVRLSAVSNKRACRLLNPAFVRSPPLIFELIRSRDGGNDEWAIGLLVDTGEGTFRIPDGPRPGGKGGEGFSN